MNSKITFPELIELVATATNTSKRMSELFLKELFATVSQSLIEGESVRIKNLGQFKVEAVKARKSVSVNTGQEVEIPHHNRLVFTPAKSLADALNEPFSHFDTVVLDDAVSDEQLAAITGDVETPDSLNSLNSPDSLDSLDSPADPEAPAIELPDPAESVPDGLESMLVTPPPFMPQVEEAAQQEEKNIEEAAPQEEEPIEETAPQEEEPIEEAAQQEEEPIEEAAPQEAEQIEEPVEKDVYSVEDIERDKREVARKSMLRGVLLGAMGMLLLVLIGWGIYAMAMSQKTVETADTVTVTHEEDMSNTEIVMRQGIAEADTAQPVEETVEEPKPAAVVTDTCTKTMFLTRMAKKHYGNSDFWVYIYEENEAIIDNPNHITPGTVVVIPPAEKYGIDPKDPESLKKAQMKSGKLFAKFRGK